MLVSTHLLKIAQSATTTPKKVINHTTNISLHLLSILALAFVLYVVVYLPFKFVPLIILSLLVQHIIFCLYVGNTQFLLVYLTVICIVSVLETHSVGVESPFTCSSIGGFYPISLWGMHVSDLANCVYEIWKGKVSLAHLVVRLDLNLCVLGVVFLM